MRLQFVTAVALALSAGVLLTACNQPSRKVATPASAEPSQTVRVPAPISAKETPRALEIRAGEHVLFDFREVQLRADASEFLDKIAAIMREQPGTTAVIEGHTDSKGGRRVNMELSEVRALMVMKALVDRGVPRGRMKAIGYGFDRPISDNETEHGRRLNRRTEIVIQNESGNNGGAPAAGRPRPPAPPRK